MTLLFFRVFLLALALTAAVKFCSSTEPLFHIANAIRVIVFCVAFYGLLYSLIFH